jgi:hypothetical protein
MSEDLDDFIEDIIRPKAPPIDLSHLPKCLARVRQHYDGKWTTCGKPVKYVCEHRCEDCWVADVYRKRTGFFAEG